MEENKVMETVEKGIERAVVDTVEVPTIPIERTEITKVDVPIEPIADDHIGIGKVVFVTGIAAAAVYGAYKLGKKMWGKFRPKKGEKKYAKVSKADSEEEEYTEEYDEDYDYEEESYDNVKEESKEETKA